MLHLHFVRPFLDVWVVGLLVLSRLVVHLLQPVALGVGVRPRPGRPVNIVDLGKSALRVLDRAHDFAVLVSRAPEADRHSLAVQPGQNARQNGVDRSQGGEGHGRAARLAVGGEARQSGRDEDLQDVQAGDDVVGHAVEDAVLEVLAQRAVVQAAVPPAAGGGFGRQEDVVDRTRGLGALVFVVQVAAAGAQEVDPDEVLEDFEVVAFVAPGRGGVGFCGLVGVAGPFFEDVHEVGLLVSCGFDWLWLVCYYFSVGGGLRG